MIITKQYFLDKINLYSKTNIYALLNDKEKMYYTSGYIFLLLIDLVKTNTNFNIKEIKVSGYLLKIFDQILNCMQNNIEFTLNISEDDINLFIDKEI